MLGVAVGAAAGKLSGLSSEALLLTSEWGQENSQDGDPRSIVGWGPRRGPLLL